MAFLPLIRALFSYFLVLLQTLKAAKSLIFCKNFLLALGMLSRTRFY